MPAIGWYGLNVDNGMPWMLPPNIYNQGTLDDSGPEPYFECGIVGFVSGNVNFVLNWTPVEPGDPSPAPDYPEGLGGPALGISTPFADIRMGVLTITADIDGVPVDNNPLTLVYSPGAGYGAMAWSTLAERSVDFVGVPLEGEPGLVVEFTDLSDPTPVEWSWDFGDGETSTEQNPTHAYAEVGQYTVTLNARFGP